MARARLHQLNSHWSTLFVAAVVLWFAATGLDLGSHLPSLSHSSHASSTSNTTTKATTTSTTPSASAGAFSFRLVSFQLAPDGKVSNSVDGDVTLEVRNTAGGNANFQPNELRLRQVGGASAAADLNTPIGVSHKLPVIVPVTFHVTPTPGASYELTYGDRVIYSGKPLGSA
jgi:hypothetical protein